MPAASTSWACTKTSEPPSSGAMKPYPRSVLKKGGAVTLTAAVSLPIPASGKGVPAMFGGVVSLNLINAFAKNRTKANVNPPAAVPQNYASAHLIRAFRNIGRISSLLFLLSHPSPVGHRPRKRKTQYGFVEGQNGFNCVSCGTHRAFAKTRTPPECCLPMSQGRGLGNPQSSAA
jgi:hypothetical protein